MRSQIILSTPDKMKMFSVSLSLENGLWANCEIDDSIKAPDEYYCPITQELMAEPVIAADGHTYEKIAIKRWLVQGGDKSKSPMTNVIFASLILTPNHTLRSAIAQFIQNKKDVIQKAVLRKNEAFSKASTPFEQAEILMDRGGLNYQRGLFDHALNDFLAAKELLKGMIEDNLFEQGMDVEFYMNKLKVRYHALICEISLAFIEVKIKPITNRDYNDLIANFKKLTAETNNLSKEIDKMLEDSDSDSNNDLEEYVEYANKNKFIRDKLPQIQAAIGDLRFQQGAYLGSLGAYIGALSSNDVVLDPEFSARYHHQQGKVYSNLGCFDEAVKSISKAIQLDGSKSSYYADRGRVYCSLGRFSKAVDDFDFACKYQKNNMADSVDHLVGSGYSKLMQATVQSESTSSVSELIAMLDSSIRDYSAAFKLAGLLNKPIIAKHYYNHGVCFVNLFLLKCKSRDEEKLFKDIDENIKKSIINFNFAIELDGGESLFYFARGVAYELYNDHKKAENDYKMACMISKRAEYLLAIANIKYESKQFSKAEEYYIDALDILESLPATESKTLRWPNFIIYSNRILGMSLLEKTCQQQSSLDTHQIICINILVGIYQQICPEVLANIFLELYYIYEKSEHKNECINEEVYDVIFTALADLIKDSKACEQSENAQDEKSFSIFEKQVINYANNFLQDDKSLSKLMIQFSTTESMVVKFRQQAEILKNVAIFCYIHKADEALAAIIKHIFRNVSLQRRSYQPHLHTLNFAEMYQQSTRKGLIEYGFISESRRREQHNQLIIDKLTTSLVQQKQDVVRENEKRIEAEKRINELESQVSTNVKKPKNNACIVLVNQASFAYKSELNIEAVYRNFLQRVDRAAQDWEPSYYCSARATPLSVSSLKTELANLGKLSSEEIKQKIVIVYQIMQIALGGNEKNIGSMLDKYKLLCEEVENQFPALLESPKIGNHI